MSTESSTHFYLILFSPDHKKNAFPCPLMNSFIAFKEFATHISINSFNFMEIDRSVNQLFIEQLDK